MNKSNWPRKESSDDEADVDTFLPLSEQDGAELSLEESNQARLQALNAIGVGVAGVNESLLMRMVETLLSERQREEVHAAHQEWLAGQLEVMEQMVQEQQRKAWLTRPANGRG